MKKARPEIEQELINKAREAIGIKNLKNPQVCEIALYQLIKNNKIG